VNDCRGWVVDGRFAIIRRLVLGRRCRRNSSHCRADARHRPSAVLAESARRDLPWAGRVRDASMVRDAGSGWAGAGLHRGWQVRFLEGVSGNAGRAYGSWSRIGTMARELRQGRPRATPWSDSRLSRRIAPTTCDSITRSAEFFEGEPRLAPRSFRDAAHWQMAPIRSRYRLARLTNQSKCCTIHADGEMRVEWL
jgi:hypothetical protein